ncbi:MAG: metal-sulfur cluster biosynthetic enzyme [Candidatus Paceibacteria bacterium]|jgi:metal-sulfur cluster biosynthetic enzyme
MPTTEEVLTELKQVFDPEIPVNIVDLGFIYDVTIAEGICKISMTLTSKTCPEAQAIPDMVRRRVNTLDGINETEVQIVWEPEWSPHAISEDGRKVLGMEDE